MPSSPLGFGTQYEVWRRPADPRRKAVGEPIGRVNPLLTPNPARPFVQLDWPRPTNPRLKAVGEPIGRVAPLLTPNPAQPFEQNLWEGERPRVKATGEAVAGNAPLLTPNPAQPFIQSDWLRALPKPKAKVDDVVNLLLVEILPPFVQSDWPLTAKIRLTITDTTIGSLALNNPGTPFSQADWPRAHNGILSDRGTALGLYPGFIPPPPPPPPPPPRPQTSVPGHEWQRFDTDPTIKVGWR